MGERDFFFSHTLTDMEGCIIRRQSRASVTWYFQIETQKQKEKVETAEMKT